MTLMRGEWSSWRYLEWSRVEEEILRDLAGASGVVWILSMGSWSSGME